jgi:hypothetical protein
MSGQPAGKETQPCAYPSARTYVFGSYVQSGIDIGKYITGLRLEWILGQPAGKQAL